MLAGTAFAQQASVPDAPAPQQNQSNPPNAPAPQPAQSSSSLNHLTSHVAPGRGTTAANEADQAQQNAGQPAPHVENGTVPQNQGPTGPDDFQKTPPIMGQPGQPVPPPPPPPPADSGQEASYTFRTGVTVVDVPIIVRNKKNQLVAGLPWWRFRVFEDGVRQNIWYFSTDAVPLSIAFVVDNTLPSDIMQKVNASFGAVTGGLTPADSVAVITYAGTGPQLRTDFTQATGRRLPAVLEQAKSPGAQMGVPEMGDPMTVGPQLNGQQVDPNLAPQRGNAGPFLVIPHESHPLNDAILFAAERLAHQPRGRRRIIYVVSDGRNVRSKATYKEVLEYLLTNNISVYGTEVGSSALWGIGYLDRVKLPLMQPDNVLPRFAYPTGGDVQAELTENGIQNAFVHITESVRTAYTIDYLSHNSALSSKYHNIEVRVEGLPGLTVEAKTGYYPSATSTQY
ncbi:MAG TPA: VWA domain-containing protein [Acidobacteriaceae bacterium]|nr:VWA domain-containing protein [Acidobacteriaceae bacterium]